MALAAAFVIASDQHSAGFFGAVLLLPFSAQNAQLCAAAIAKGQPQRTVQIGGYRVQRIHGAVTVGNETLAPGAGGQLSGELIRSAGAVTATVTAPS